MKIDISNIKLLDSLSIHPGNLLEKLNFLDPWVIEFSDISIDPNHAWNPCRIYRSQQHNS